MEHDGSIASQVEEWAVETLSAFNEAQSEPRPFGNVGVYTGATVKAGESLAHTLTSGVRTPVISVFASYTHTREEGDTVRDLQMSLFVVIGVKNGRDYGASRRGDGVTIGISRAVEIVEAVLNSGRPGVSDPDNRRVTTQLQNPRATLLEEDAGAYVAMVEFEVRLAPKLV